MQIIEWGEGKYGVVLNENGTVSHFLRHHEHWQAMDDMIHSNCILSLVQELQDLRERLNHAT
ncbi:hypothetical protein [Caulobacter phage Cr30]|uniref:hypothetical protein n=1 Tax=Caulobacter phage Cr30 TaxID=1357714 RepID=UPI0004A9B951|nr:hypothetical protein OZ74_gp093 [Caulobacter phage Cr30]AGS80978.1 hypothetical protein [Caulobacter phage Cr30]